MFLDNRLTISRFQGEEEIPAYNLVCLNDRERWVRTDASDPLRMPAIGLTLNPLRIGQTGEVLQYGCVNYEGWSWTPKKLLYADTVDGGMIMVPPSNSGDQVQVVGRTLSQTLIMLNPSYVLVEVI